MKIGSIPTAVAAFKTAGRVLGVFGVPGCGKTAMVREAAVKLSATLGQAVHVEELHLASMSEVDVRGYLIPDGGSSRFTKPPFWGAVEAHEHGILFLDEFPQAPHEVQKAVAPLLLDRRVGDYQLPPGWSVVVAGNRVEDNAGANSLLSHVLNRIAYVEVEPDPEAWMVWAFRNGMDPMLVAFAKLRPGTVFGAEPPAADTPWCTPRSLHALSDVATAYGGLRDLLLGGADNRQIAEGLVGKAAAHEVMAMLATAELLPDFDAIMDDPEGSPLPDKLDAKYIAVTMVAMRAANLDENRPGNAAKNQKQLKAAAAYLQRFDVNFALVGLAGLSSRRKDVTVYCADWLLANQRALGEYRRYL